MFSEPSGWLFVVLSVLGLIVGILQLIQTRRTRCHHRHTRFEHVRILKVFGISYTSHSIKHDDHQP